MNSKTVRCLTWEMFNAFVKVISNFYSCKANVQFTFYPFAFESQPLQRIQTIYKI